MSVYYNEFDPKAAAWLRELIAQGHIAYGDVDERSIEDVSPADLAGYSQCHFFAGIGVWSHALRRAGWADERPVWTGSCPCQPFSAAGKGAGFADERHLWPAFHHLISVCRPPVVFGEQVASKDGLGWLDLVQADLEGSGYAVGAVDLCAAGVGAPHIRQRLWWVAERLDDTTGARHFGPVGDAEGLARDEARLRLSGAGREADLVEHTSGDGRIERRAEPSRGSLASGRGLGGLADSDDAGLEGRGQPGRERAAKRLAGPDGVAGGVAHYGGIGRGGRQGLPAGRKHDGQDAGWIKGNDGPVCVSEVGLGPQGPGPVNGVWRDADWLYCRDGKWRPVGSGSFPLAHGAPARVGRLRGYGNAIVAPAAQAFIEAYLEAREPLRLMSDLAGDVFA